jgi:arylsulfatase A-like enzyme
MLSVLLAALLSGTALSAISYIFVALSGAPVWLGPGIFLITWLADVTALGTGLVIIDLTLRRISYLRKILEDEGKKFFVYLCLALIVGSAGLAVLVARDVSANQQLWSLLLIIGLVGLPTLLLLRAAAHRMQSILVRVLAASLVLIFLANGVYFVVDQHYAAKIQERSAHFTGTVPHVLLLVMDTCRSDHFSCNGYAFTTTPNIDRIAAEGMMCSNAYSASNWTPPGHISIFTGKYPAQHGNGGKPFMPDDLVSLTEVLHQQGYYCVSIYENPLAGKSINLTQGFDYDFGVLHNSWIYTIPLRLWDKFVYNDDGAYVSFATARKVSEWVEDKGGHLFLYVNVAEPHVPYRVNQPYFSQFTRNLDMSKVSDLARIQNLCVTRDIIIQDSVRFQGFSAESFAYLRAIYDSELAYDDEHFGRLADWMRSTGRLDKTLLVITADHGEVLGEHLTLGHEYTLFKPAVHIPLIMRYPKAIRPSRMEQCVSNVDVFPTVLNLAGYADKIPSDISGVDILKLTPEAHRSLLCSNMHRGGQFSLLDGDYKLIYNREENLRKFAVPDTLLYDFAGDRQEAQDLHKLDQGQSDRMMSQLNNWIADLYVAPRDSFKVSRETQEAMRALGYVH